MTVEVGVLHSRIGTDDKRLLNALRNRGHDVTKVDVRRQAFSLTGDSQLATADVVIDRCIASSRSRYLTAWCDRQGIPVVNAGETAAICADKVRTSLALADAGVSTPQTTVAFSIEAALDAMDQLGYPCVLKPVVGSWGRLLARIEHREMGAAILEHKATLGHYEHRVFYLQSYHETGGQDLRVLTADGEAIAGMRRVGDGWIANAARGAEVTPIEVDDTLAEVVAEASAAVGGGLLGIDLLETDEGYTVHEVNHTVEFEALDGAVDLDVPGAIVTYLEHVATAPPASTTVVS